MTARRLILRNFQSPGDIVMLTAAVRDLHRSNPGQFVTDVRTPCPQLWENNPHLTPLKEDYLELLVRAVLAQAPYGGKAGYASPDYDYPFHCFFSATVLSMDERRLTNLGSVLRQGVRLNSTPVSAAIDLNSISMS